MANRIFKYQLQVEQRQVLQLPKDAQLLSVAVIDEQAYLFAQVDTWVKDGEHLPFSPKPRIIRIARTGEVFNAGGSRFIGTLVFNVGHTFHVYEQPEGVKDDPREERFQGDYEEIVAYQRGRNGAE